MASLKELSMKEELLCGGHRACAGCAAPIAIRQALTAVNTDVVVGCATGCLEVTTTISSFPPPYVAFIHNTFFNLTDHALAPESPSRRLS